jgi:hypothetical protein
VESKRGRIEPRAVLGGSSLTLSAKPVRVGTASQQWTFAGEQSSLVMHIATAVGTSDELLFVVAMCVHWVKHATSWIRWLIRSLFLTLRKGPLGSDE